MNDLAAANTRGGNKFITFFWGVLDANSRTLQYVNAGHNPPIVLRTTGAVEYLDRGGLILGVLPTMKPYEQGSVVLERGDVLVLYTDGVSEAMNAQEEDFSEERMLEVLRGLRTQSATGILSGLLAAVETHAGSTPQSDDITVLILRAT
jgi:sigma-B regulation protein RsbU (phosphoserine phosphatase)